MEDSYEHARQRLGARAGDPALGTRLSGYDDERDEGRWHACRLFVNGGSLDALVADVAAAVADDFGVPPVGPDRPSVPPVGAAP